MSTSPSMIHEPLVTLIVPVRNEAAHLESCLQALMSQQYPYGRLEIIVVDGMSEDGTIEIAAAAAERDPRIRVILNPERTMAAGLNRGIDQARGEIIGVISGHSRVEADYVSRVVGNLRRTDAWSTGGAIVRTADTPMQRAIAGATGSPIGVGDAEHNYGTRGGWVDAVFPGIWPRRVFDAIGLFDVDMPFNEDNELSLRIRRAGGRIWYDPAVRVHYVPRGSLSGLFTQYRRYARGRLRVFRKHRAGLGWRHLLPPLLVAWLAVGWIGALASPVWRAIWTASIVAYLLAVLVGTALTARGANPVLAAVAAVTMHIGYGMGMLQGLWDLAVRARPRA